MLRFHSYIFLILASVSDRGSTVASTDWPGSCPVCSSECQGTKLMSSHPENCLYLSLICCYYSFFTRVSQGVTVGTATCVQLHKRAEKIAAALTEKGSINTGENVVLLYPPGKYRFHLAWLVWVLNTFLSGWVQLYAASFPQALIW